MNQITASKSRLELPRRIAHEPGIFRIIEIFPGDAQISAPRARIMLAKVPINSPSHQERRSFCHYLLQRLLNSISTTQRQRWELSYTASGAPCLASEGCHGLYVSLSRSGEWLAAGVSHEAGIGVDVESIKSRLNIAEKVEFLNWKVSVDNLEDFYSKWTLWEASVKCLQGSVFMRDNPGFEKLCHIDMHNRVGKSGAWHGLQDCLDEKALYSVVLQCETNTDLIHRTLRMQKVRPWLASNKSSTGTLVI